jgi:hypothetical protein
MRRFITVVTLAGVSTVAVADKNEWCIGAGGGGAVMNAHAGGTDGTGIGYETHGRLGYGVSNALELGLIGTYSHTSDIAFDDAMLAGQTGKLFGDASMVAVQGELRWTPGLGLARAFERTGP